MCITYPKLVTAQFENFSNIPELAIISEICKSYIICHNIKLFLMSRGTAKPIKWLVHPAKTQISLRSLIRVFAVRLKKL